MHDRPCQRTRLATSPMVTIDACSCAMIHLNVGATTVRFTPDAFEGLSTVILEAVAELATRREACDSPATTLRLGPRPRGAA